MELIRRSTRKKWSSISPRQNDKGVSADLWCSKVTPVMAEYYAEEDVHPLKYLRINTVLQQFDEFLDTYGIEKGDNMYLAPEDRVCIW